MQLILACSNRWSCQVACPGDAPGIRMLLASFAAFELPPRYTLACYAFMAGPLYFFHYAGQVLFTSSCHPAILLYYHLPSPLRALWHLPRSLLSLGFYCMFYGNFQTLDALCTSNAFNAFQVFHSWAGIYPLLSLQYHPYPCAASRSILLQALILGSCSLHICACPSCLPSANLDGPKCTWAELCVSGSICDSIYSTERKILQDFIDCDILV